MANEYMMEFEIAAAVLMLLFVIIGYCLRERTSPNEDRRNRDSAGRRIQTNPETTRSPSTNMSLSNDNLYSVSSLFTQQDPFNLDRLESNATRSRHHFDSIHHPDTEELPAYQLKPEDMSVTIQLPPPCYAVDGTHTSVNVQ